MTDNVKDKDFIEYAVKMLVDNPDDVKVERKIDEMGVLITLDVNSKDMGMVIGREGMTAKALRTLLRVIGARNNARVNLKINEPEGSERPPREPREFRGAVREERAAPAAPSASDRPSRDGSLGGPEEKKTLDDVMNDIQL
ncbi:MAG: KH domain-containing protein [bacterium]|nr:KH domain-containing protein [bacterium]